MQPVLFAVAGKLATLRGTVTRMSHVRPLIVEMSFTCCKCGTSIITAMPDGRFTPPTRCAGEAKQIDQVQVVAL